MRLLVTAAFCLSLAGCALPGDESSEPGTEEANYQACVDAFGPMNVVGNLIDTRLNANSLATLQRAGTNIAVAPEQADGDVAAPLNALVTAIDQTVAGKVLSWWPKLTEAFAACQA